MRAAGMDVAGRAGLGLVFLLAAIADAASAARVFPGAADADLVMQSWIGCAHSLVRVNDIIARISPDAIVEEKLLSSDNIQNAIAVLPLKTKLTFLNCLREHNLPVFKNDGNPESWLTRYAMYFLSRHASSRRHLNDHLVKTSSSLGGAPPITTTSILNIGLSPSTNPAPAPLPVPSSGQAPNPAFIPAPASIGFRTPAHSPSISPNPAPPINSPFHSPINFPFHSPINSPLRFLKPRSDSPSPMRVPRRDGSVAGLAPAGASFTASENHTDSTKAVVIAVVITGTVSFTLSAIFFYCYTKCCARRNSEAAKSERPLLSLSDFSDGSSRKSYVVGNTMHNDKVGVSSFGIDQAQNGHVFSLDIDTSLNETLSHGTIPGSYKLPVGPSSILDVSTEPYPPPPPPPPLPVKPLVAKKAPPPLGPPPPPPKVNPHAPPPPKGVLPPHPPPLVRGLSRLGPNHPGNAASKSNALGSKTKLKPFFWDKVMANPDQSMVWHQIKSGSFQFNEEMIETLFCYNVSDNHKSEDKKGPFSNASTSQLVQIIDPKKSQNLAILLRALNVGTEDVCLALTEGNELPRELIQTLLKMPPTAEEELKLRLYNGDVSQLHTAERLLKALMDIPFAYKRLDLLLFMCSFQEDVSTINESFKTLKAACAELRSSRLFRKLLEAVLKTGNRMNDGTYRGGAQAFKLDTLLKLSDVKGTDGKTTLLHFVVQEIIRTEGIKAARAAREDSNHSGSSLNSGDFLEDSPCNSGDHYRSLGLKVVSGLGNELSNVKKAAALDASVLTSMAANLGHGMARTKEFLNGDMNGADKTSGFKQSLEWLVEHAEFDVVSLAEEEKTIQTLVKSTTDYFHGNAGKDEGLRLFVIVRDFLGILEKVCNEIRQASADEPKAPTSKEALVLQPVSDTWHPLFPAIQKHRLDLSSSDEDSP